MQADRNGITQTKKENFYRTMQMKIDLSLEMSFLLISI
jgi:hypothetical protein